MKHFPSILSCTRKIKCYTPYHIRKQLAELLILSKPDYGNISLQNTSLIKKNAVDGKYSLKVQAENTASTESGAINAKWVSIEERLIYAICQVAYKSLYDPQFSNYMKLNLK